MKYRSEIDGLRAIAVLPVIFFHAGFEIFSGGFIGVDIFFVISGYLITRIILDELANGTFSIARFYERRARRILPALFLVMLVCIPFAWLWMLPSQYIDFSRSLIAVVLFISNISFWRESGYFAAAAEEKPLLHTWSLAVEEQFYLFFPLALLLLWRFGKRSILSAIIVMAIISFGLCEFASRYYPIANFFLIPMRAWELFIGAICAIAYKESQAKKNNLLSILGLAAIVFSIFVYDEQMRLPSAYTALPVIGTALIIIYGTKGSWVARLLSLRLCVAIGLISYSAYLWHQPLFAFARIGFPETPSSQAMFLLAIASLILGALTWRFVEQPFRNKKHFYYVSTRPALYLAVTIATILVAVGMHGYISEGRMAHWKTTTTPDQLRAYQLLTKEKNIPRTFDNGDCVFRIETLNEGAESRIVACKKKYGSGIAIIGDSHAAELLGVLESSRKQALFIADFSQALCRPHSPLAICKYDKVLTLVQRNPTLFHNIIYEQAGSHLFVDRRGRATDRNWFINLHMDEPVQNFTINVDYIQAVKAYLSKLTPYAQVTWFGPRIEPQIRESDIIRLGCNHRFELRPNFQALFEDLDKAIKERLKDTAIRYVSQIGLLQFDINKDFINCDAIYWIDGDHFSPTGRQRFGQRITLEKLLQP